MNLPTSQQLAGLGRDAMKIGGTVVTVAAAFSALSPDQVATVMANLKHIQADLSDLWISGGSLLATIGVAWTLWQNTHKSLVQSAATVPGTTVITTPAIAKASPKTNILSNATVTTVTKP